jgi:RNA polymerase-binding transcription factor DksA
LVEIDEVRRRLERRLARLDARSTKIEADLRKPGDRDWQERATEAENDEVLEKLGLADLSEIREIRSALSRLENGTYGSCGECSAPIAEGRLEALPFTTVCIDCAK